MRTRKNLRTWIEIDASALEHNLRQFLKLIRTVGKASGDARPKRTRFMAVVKSNGYGHGLVDTARFLANLQLTTYNLQQRLWFGVDSITEALRLRKENIANPILVLGFTLPGMMQDAARNDIVISVSNFDSLADLARAKEQPLFHLKFDTGMHRQGFLPEQTLRLIQRMKRYKLSPQGMFTHFAAAKDIAYPTYTLEQLRQFNAIALQFKRAGFKNIIRHAAASGGTLLFPETHLDMVRVGMGLYGYWPSYESQVVNYSSGITLRPALTWKTIVAETKEIAKGSFVGYDCTECVSRKTNIAVLPVGYWHGYDRGLSGIGEVLICGRRRKILGRVSMDMITVDATDRPRVRAGDTAALIGKQGKEALWADELALKISTSPYEFLTRINPLIHRFFYKK